MFDLVRQENPPRHLFLGKAAVKTAHDKFTELLEELAGGVKIGESADFPA